MNKNKRWYLIPILLGWLLGIFFALALVGYLAMPGKWENLGAGLVTAVLLAVCILTIRYGIYGLQGRRRSWFPWKKPSEAAQPTAADSVWQEEPRSGGAKDTRRTCQNCGASDYPDARGCCPFCGAAFPKE